jgi:hypothetical protein
MPTKAMAAPPRAEAPAWSASVVVSSEVRLASGVGWGGILGGAGEGAYEGGAGVFGWELGVRLRRCEREGGDGEDGGGGDETLVVHGFSRRVGVSISVFHGWVQHIGHLRGHSGGVSLEGRWRCLTGPCRAHDGGVGARQ